MAHAIRRTPTPVPDSIELHLTMPEARTLKQLFLVIGGDPEISPRKHTDDINSALISAGVLSAHHVMIGKPDVFYDDVERSTL